MLSELAELKHEWRQKHLVHSSSVIPVCGKPDKMATHVKSCLYIPPADYTGTGACDTVATLEREHTTITNPTNFVTCSNFVNWKQITETHSISLQKQCTQFMGSWKALGVCNGDVPAFRGLQFCMALCVESRVQGLLRDMVPWYTTAWPSQTIQAMLE